MLRHVQPWDGRANPAALSPWGTTGPAVASILHEILKRASADLESAAKGIRIQEMRQNLSVTLARSLAKQLALKNRIIEDPIDEPASTVPTAEPPEPKKGHP